MTIWDICIRRPIFTAMLVSVPIVLGLASYRRLGVDLFPNVDVPVVTVTTTQRGASVESMETDVTKPIEEAVNTISGIDELRSTTKEGVSQVTIQFVLEKDGAVGAQEVDAKVRTILSQLPQGTDPPIIDKFDIDASPVLTIVVSGRRDPREVTELARKRVKEDIESLHGVGSVVLIGGRKRAINVILDPEKMQKYENLTVVDVRNALRRENQDPPGGRVEQGQVEKSLRTMARFEHPRDFEYLIVGNRNGQPIYLSDIGEVVDSYEEPRTAGRLWIRDVHGDDGESESAVTLIVQKQSGTNTVEVVDRVKKRLKQIEGDLPSDIKIEVIRDQSRFIKNSIDEVKIHLLLAAGLVSATILLFIRDWRTTVIATLSIPTSIIGTFAFMDFMGFTINNMTMIGLILAVGIVIDDAVVVHENIFRHMEEHGLSAFEAASKATREIALPVLATTLSLLVIFIPIAFMGGQVGRFFNCFGYVIGFAVLISMCISFTMTPMLCALFLKAESGAHSKTNFVWQWIENGYDWILRWSLRYRFVIVILSLITLVSLPFLMGAVGKNFVPRDDQSEFELSLTFPEGYSLQRSEQECISIEKRLRGLRGVTHTFTVIGDTSGKVTRGQGEVTKATIYVRMIDLSERKYTQFEVMNDARVILADYPDVRGAVQDVSAIQASGFRQVEIDLNLRGPDIQKLEKYSEEIKTWMKEQGHYVDVDTSLSLRKPEVRIKPKRERASELGVSVEDLAVTSNIMVGGEPVTKYKENDEQYDVWLRAKSSARGDREAIGRLNVPSSRAQGGTVRLENVASVEEAQGPNTIDRFARQRQVVISANLEGKDLSGSVEELDAHLQEMDMPSEYRYEFIGRAKMMGEANTNFLIAFGLAFLFMYMILAAQFESFVHPFTILLALPLTLPFAILSLLLLRTSLDIYSLFGLFMLFGIVKKNGILQVDYTNVLREQGMERNEAILEANRTRLRPILMTTVMLVAAMVPMALGTGPGAGARAGMAKVILGGQSLSLLLTLLVVPVAYSLWDDFTRWVRRRTAPQPATGSVPL